MSHQQGERTGGRDRVGSSRVWGSSLSLWPGGDRYGSRASKERLSRSDALLSEAKMYSRGKLSQKKC